jgi:hypothetical protein
MLHAEWPTFRGDLIELFLWRGQDGQFDPHLSLPAVKFPGSRSGLRGIQAEMINLHLFICLSTPRDVADQASRDSPRRRQPGPPGRELLRLLQDTGQCPLAPGVLTDRQAKRLMLKIRCLQPGRHAVCKWRVGLCMQLPARATACRRALGSPGSSRKATTTTTHTRDTPTSNTLGCHSDQTAQLHTRRRGTPCGPRARGACKRCRAAPTPRICPSSGSAAPVQGGSRVACVSAGEALSQAIACAIHSALLSTIPARNSLPRPLAPKERRASRRHRPLQTPLSTGRPRRSRAWGRPRRRPPRAP